MTDSFPHNVTIRPDPDPTDATRGLVLREVEAVEKALNIRLNEMDKAVKLFQENLVRVPTETDKAVGHLKELHEKWFGEMFESVQVQFDLRDEAMKAAAQETKDNIKTARDAAEKASEKQGESFRDTVDKLEKSVTKQIDGIITNMGTVTRGLEDKANEQKERISRLESTVTAQTAVLASQQTARGERRGDQTVQQMSSSWILALILGAIGAGGFVLEIIRFASGK